jgi:hypothetical protein
MNTGTGHNHPKQDRKWAKAFASARGWRGAHERSMESVEWWFIHFRDHNTEPK